MTGHRRAAGLLAALLLAGAGWLPVPPANAQIPPADPVDCEGPAGDPAPGTDAWRERDTHNIFCAQQRHLDKAAHPGLGGQPPGFFFDAYRQPERHDGVRFRYDVTTIGEVTAEVYRPCTATSCPERPESLQAFEPPYPAVVTLHGGASRRELHRWSSQPLAEAGYLVVTIDATGLSPTTEEALAVLEWLDAGEGLAADFDGGRVGLAGHSAGGVIAGRLGQQDPRVSAIVSWDRAQSSPLPEGLSIDTPALFFFADYNCQRVPACQPHPYEEPPDPTGPGNKGDDFLRVRDAGVDTMQIGLRAATHLDWVPTLLSGNRYAEIVTVYYTLAWFDRYLKDADDAFARLRAETFDDSADHHNISQGLFDPMQAATSADPYGGNLPYTLADKPVADRLSFYFHSKCFLTEPRSGSRATSEDMRTTGCGVAPES